MAAGIELPGEKVLIWVPKEFGKEYEKVTDDNTRLKLLEEFLATTRKDIREEYESSLKAMEEDALIYEGLALKTKQRFTEVKDEAVAAAYSVWQKYDEEVSKMKKKAQEMTTTLKPLVDELKGIEELTMKVNTFGVEKLTKAVEAMNNLHGQNKEMFDFLVKNFKIETDLEKKSW